METVIPHELGIDISDPELLRDRYRISTGIVLLDPLEAERAGYNKPEPGVGVIAPLVDTRDPLRSLRIPTNEEISAITATQETRRVMQLVRLPKAIGISLLQQCVAIQELGVKANSDMKRELAPGIIGVPLSARVDGPNQLNVTVNPALINRFTGLPPKVGDHVDGYADPNIALIAANMGPGERWHRITPDLNRDNAGEKRLDRYQFMHEHPNPESLPVHWLRLQPPTDEYVEAIVNSPVSWALHEGSTLGSSTPSEAFFCMTDPIMRGAYPSIV